MEDNTITQEEEKYSIPWFGVVLIVAGSLLLLGKLHLLRISYWQIVWSLVMFFGMIRVGRGFTQNRRGKIFWGTSLFLFGLFFFLRTIESLDIHLYMFSSSMFLIFGLAFFMVYLSNVRDWYVLIPSLLLIAVGVLLLLGEFGYISQWEVWDAIHLYWPIALILLGLGIILRRRAGTQSSQIVS